MSQYVLSVSFHRRYIIQPKRECGRGGGGSSYPFSPFSPFLHPCNGEFILESPEVNKDSDGDCRTEGQGVETDSEIVTLGLWDDVTMT